MIQNDNLQQRKRDNTNRKQITQIKGIATKSYPFSYVLFPNEIIKHALKRL